MPTIPEALSVAVQHHQAGQLQQAERIYRNVLRADPNHGDSLHLLGVIAHQKGDHTAAAELIRRAIRVNPNEAIYHSNLGRVHQTAGDLREAEACYRRALEIRPDFTEAHSALGAALQEQGEVDQAVAAYQRAIQIDPNCAEAHFNLGTVWERQGDLGEAERAYRRALEVKPDYVEAHYNLGNVLTRLEEFDAAESSYRRAVRIQPDHAEAHNNLGNVLKEKDRLDEAADCYRSALQIQPDFADAHCNLGNVLREEGRFDEAAACYREAVCIKPDCAEAHNNLGSVLKDQYRLDEAAASLKRALEIDPGLAEAHNNLGNVLLAQGRHDEAVASYRRALQSRPDYAEAYNHLGIALTSQGKYEGAAAAHRRALEIDPDCAEAHFHLGFALQKQEKLDKAAKSFERAVEQEPDQALWELRLQPLCPAVFQSNQEIDEYRHRLLTELTRLSTRKLELDFTRISAFGPMPPFNLLYQGRDNRQIKEAFANVLRNCFPAWEPVRRSGKPRVGFVVTHHHEGVFLFVMQGMLEHMDSKLFDVFVVCSQEGAAVIEKALHSDSVQILALPGRFDLAVATIREAAFDLLYYWEVASGPTNYYLPFFRLAPLQCTSAGIPETSGIPQMDYYLFHELWGEEDADRYYTETLLRTKTNLAYVRRAVLPEPPKTRTDFGFSADQHVYACLQKIEKFHPDFDPILAGIARRDPAGVIAIVRDESGRKADALRKRFSTTIPDVLDQIVFLPRQTYPDYLCLVTASDVLLDTLHYGGGTTCYHGFSLGKPIVTLPTPLQASRTAYAMYKRMGIDDCIAAEAEQYVELAVRLATDADFRAAVEEKIRAFSPLLFEDMESVRELERVFQELIAKARSRANA